MSEYVPEDEGPEARLARQQYEHERRVHLEIVKLFNSIPPEASTWELFTHEERQRYGIKKHRK
jgi:hypothetical protein